MLPYNKNLKAFSRTLRSNQTDAELILWHAIRKKQLCGMQFYRQKPIAGYIADFYCAKAKLVIELDGEIHDHANAREYDAISPKSPPYPPHYERGENKAALYKGRFGGIRGIRVKCYMFFY